MKVKQTGKDVHKVTRSVVVSTANGSWPL